MRSLFISAALLVSSASSSFAITTVPFGDDSDFIAACPNQVCEQVVAEARIGGTNTYELGFQEPGVFGINTEEFNWVNGQTESFVLSFTNNVMTWQVGNVQTNLDMSTTNAGSLDATKSLLIRAANSSGQDNSTSLTNIMLQGTSIPDLSASGVARQTPYLQVFGFDWTSNWSLSGDITLAWDPAGPRPTQSSLSAQFKFTDLEAKAIPLPAPFLMLGAALGALGLLRARRLA